MVVLWGWWSGWVVGGRGSEGEAGAGSKNHRVHHKVLKALGTELSQRVNDAEDTEADAEMMKHGLSWFWLPARGLWIGVLGVAGFASVARASFRGLFPKVVAQRTEGTTFRFSE